MGQMQPKLAWHACSRRKKDRKDREKAVLEKIGNFKDENAVLSTFFFG